MSDPKRIIPSILWFRHSALGWLQLAGGTMLLALMAANVPSLLSSATVSHHGLDPLLGLIAAVSMVLCVAVILVSRSASRRLNRLTESVLALTEGYGETAPSFAVPGDEIDQLAQALDGLREITRRAMVSEANLDAAVENMVEGIVMIAADGKVALHNQRLLAIFGLPPMNAIGMARAEFNAMLVSALRWPQSAQDYLQKQLAAVRSDGNYRVFDVELPNSRVLRYSASMLADGNVMSYIEDISEQRAAAASILRLAHYDTLTELPNRALFQERLTSAVEAAERELGSSRYSAGV